MAQYRLLREYALIDVAPYYHPLLPLGPQVSTVQRYRDQLLPDDVLTAQLQHLQAIGAVETVGAFGAGAYGADPYGIS